MKSLNKIFAITGVSGSGKTTILKAVMDNELISVTTRSPRVGESEGNPYYFISHEKFSELHNSGKLVESNDYSGHGNNYGITREEYEYKISQGDCFFVCDYVGMKQIKELHPNCVTIYILVSKETAEERMRMRGDSEEEIEKRLSTYEEEVEQLIYYDYIIENEDIPFEEAVERVSDIVKGY